MFNLVFQLEMQYAIVNAIFKNASQLAKQYAIGNSIFYFTVQCEMSRFNLQFNIQSDWIIIDWITESQIG